MGEMQRGNAEMAMRSREYIAHTTRERYADSLEETRRRAKYIFGVPEGVELTRDELEDVQNFSEYAGKQLVFAELFANEVPGKFFRQQDHDLTHAIVTYGHSEGRSVVPEFLRAHPEDMYLDPQVLQEEITANLWGEDGNTMFNLILAAGSADDFLNHVEYSPEILARMRSEIGGLHSRNYEDAVLFNHVLYRELLRRTAIRKAEESGEDTSRYTDLDGPFEAAMRYIKEHPDPMFITVTRNIFDHRDDPKILLREFQRVCAPLLTALKNRTQ